MKRLVAVVAVLASVSVFAQTGEQKPVNDDTGRDHKFGLSHVPGQLIGPTVPVTYGRPKAHFDSMVRVRTDFAPELQKSVDSLK